MAEGGGRGAQGSRRPRGQARRCYRVEFTLTEQEFAALAEAAGRVRLARGAYAAQVVVAYVNGGGTWPETPNREALLELVRAAGLARKIGGLLNQAVKRRAVTTAAAASSTAAEFFARLDAAGITVRQRHSAKNPGPVTGYAVALPGDVTKDGNPVWYSGGKLAADLTWPKLAHRWAGSGPAPVGRVTAAEQDAIWDHAGRGAADAAARIRVLAGTDPAGAADAAWAASDTLHAAAAALGSRALRRAAHAYDRAARAPFGCVPARSPAGDRLRHSARLLGALVYLSRDPANAPLVLIVGLAALVEAVAELREAQRHAAQAAAALTAAKHLHTAARAAAPRPAAPVRPASAAQLAATAFPKTAPGRRPEARPPRPGQDPPRPARRPIPPRPRGPAQ